MPRRLATRTLLAGLLLSGPVAAQQPSLLDDARRLNEVAAQKVESDVRQALAAEPVRPTAAEAARAALRFRSVLAGLEANDHLTPDRKAQLVRTVRSRLREMEVLAAAADRTPDDRIVQEGRPARRKADQDRDAERTAQMRVALTAIEGDLKAGRGAEAQKQADELAARFPDHPASQSLKRTADLRDRVRQAQELLAETERRTVAAMRDIDKSALPPKGDVEFPADWKDKVAKRSADTLPPKERAILKALETPVPANFRDTPFREVLEYISDLTGQPILYSKQDLADVQIEYTTPVTFQPRGASVRSVLRKVLGDHGLTYVIRDGHLQVTSQVRARDMLTVKTYYLGDLVAGIGPWGGGLFDRLQTQQNMQNLVSTIQASIDPSSWKANGGPGTISYDVPSMTLIVRQTAEVHALLQTSLRR